MGYKYPLATYYHTGFHKDRAIKSVIDDLRRQGWDTDGLEQIIEVGDQIFGFVLVWNYEMWENLYEKLHFSNVEYPRLGFYSNVFDNISIEVRQWSSDPYPNFVLNNVRMTLNNTVILSKYFRFTAEFDTDVGGGGKSEVVGEKFAIEPEEDMRSRGRPLNPNQPLDLSPFILNGDGNCSGHLSATPAHRGECLTAVVPAVRPCLPRRLIRTFLIPSVR
ncbi:MAG: hypothetical protein M5R36_06230 [Deltaproteobacteria bacterium]|nr:hypothetical protein [Deltaproteobacteria bacterium]